ncbi:glycosyltransferase family 29-domain-containing protein [Pavlovales sp. CCMP2436]|nr:glycosyltransferase family 29-domain-containing protein [Pavlovales sp. CCMP2436]|mmetsp:Transcript_48463/g.113381  ORF Transcript_48463/g.113381 Transcript_48463/m.113381 type:complete len:490 (-) Transcript_48463:182-1651(-)
MNETGQMVNETAVRVRLCLIHRRSPFLQLVAVVALLLVVLRGLFLPSERLERSVAAPRAASDDVASRAPASDAAPSAAFTVIAAALGIPVNAGSDFTLALPSAQELDERGRARAARPGRDPVMPRSVTVPQPSLVTTTPGASQAITRRVPAAGCWKAPRESLEYPFNENMASIVWSWPLQTAHGPLDDVSPQLRVNNWPPARRKQLFEQLPDYEQVRRLRYRSCAVVGSSPEVLLYEDGAEIDRHDAVFRANMAKVNGYQKYVGNRTTVRVINPVESVIGARRESLGGVRQGGDETIVIKNQDPPSIRDPTAEHAKFLAEKVRIAAGRGDLRPDYLSRRHIMELCNFLFLQSGVALGDLVLAGLNVNLTSIAAKFGASARSNEWKPWHPMGVGIPKFSQVHCSTGTVLLTEALLLCDKVRIYGFHACDCKRVCARKRVDERNHYWDTRPTPKFDQMAARYTSHMRFYHKLRAACEFDFEIARLGHCDYP